MALQVNGPLGPSLAALVGELEQHGLSREALVFWVAFCRSQTTGSITFHHFQGHLELYEPHYKKQMAAGEVPVGRV